ncbi:MAG: type IV pilus twitching motility protein PilT [Planctomycetales bacterium]|nr:type IV pilus twitching motility protein PilT [Planctomycetales bacterium]
MTPILPVDSSFAPTAYVPAVNATSRLAPSASADAFQQTGHIFQPLTARAGTEHHRVQLDALLNLCVERRASDVHLTGGMLPYFRIDSGLVPIGDLPLSAHDVEQMAESLMTDHQHRVFAEKQSLDLAFFTSGMTRFRVNIFRQRGCVAMAFRRLDDVFKTLAQLNLPPQLGELSDFPYGLVLVTGPTGSGKSTTLATIIHQINSNRNCHIITIEDPIEYVHRNNKSLVHQRELFCDVPTFASALRAALREDPDVILVGEMRDFETIQAAIIAAETGHLVFSTLHTGDCVGSISRMVSVFPSDEQVAVREQLSRTLRAVVSQRLIRRMDGKGRVPAVEIMRVNSAIANLIRLGDQRQIYSVMQTGSDDGMLILDQGLANLTVAGLISKDEAFIWCRDSSVFEARLRMAQKR